MCYFYISSSFLTPFGVRSLYPWAILSFHLFNESCLWSKEKWSNLRSSKPKWRMNTSSDKQWQIITYRSTIYGSLQAVLPNFPWVIRIKPQYEGTSILHNLNPNTVTKLSEHDSQKSLIIYTMHKTNITLLFDREAS